MSSEFESVGVLTDLQRHGMNVKQLCMLILEKLDIDECISNDILLAAEMHDTGKYFVPNHVIDVPRKLTEVERLVVDMHSYYGYLFLKEEGYSEFVCQLVLLHHGLNKPRYGVKLLDEAIKYHSVILAADVFDALMSDRSYRKRMRINEAMGILRGMAINEDVLNALSELVDEGLI